jgi:hypothetical protein
MSKELILITLQWNARVPLIGLRPKWLLVLLYCLFVCLFVCLFDGVYRHFQQYFSYIVAVSCIDGGNRRTRRKPPTCRKSLRRVWGYQRGNQNPYIEEEQITQWPKEKVQKDKQRSTRHTYKTKDRVTRTRGELRCFGRMSSSCSTSDTRRINLVTNPVISYERGKDREVFTTSGTYPWSLVTEIFHSGQPSHGGDRKTFEVMTST